MTNHAGHLLHPALREWLDADRESYNQRFRIASLHGPTLDHADFFSHMIHRVEPIVVAVNAVFSERTRSVVSELYDVSLDLFQTGYFGKESRVPSLDELWTRVLPRIPHLIGRDARRLVGGLSNALIQLASQPFTRVQEWLDETTRVAIDCQSSAELLDAIAILAWRSGMAQFRSGAMSKLQTMPRSNAIRCLGLEPTIATKDWEQILSQLSDNEWFDPQSPASDKSNVAVTKRVSCFRGFGGSIMSPPTVGLHEGRVVIRDEASVWQLYADCYGWHLHRLGDVNATGSTERSRVKNAAAVHIDDAGRVQWGKTKVEFKYLAGASSQAFDGKTLAVTVPTSFHVFLIADTATSKGSA